MPQPVIDALERVQIDQQQRDLLVLPYSLRNRLAEPVTEQTAIGEPGQLVVAGQRKGGCFVSLEPCQLSGQLRIDVFQLPDNIASCMNIGLTLDQCLS
jgi:hypothetical protein